MNRRHRKRLDVNQARTVGGMFVHRAFMIDSLAAPKLRCTVGRVALRARVSKRVRLALRPPYCGKTRKFPCG